MLKRVADLADFLASAPLVTDEAGDDHDNCAVAIQALTTILVTRDLRARMPHWEEMVNERGQHVKRLRSDVPPTPEETAEGERRWAEMIAARQPPAAHLFDGERYAHLPGGAPSSRSEMNAVMKEKHLIPISDNDARNGTHLGKTPDMGEIVRAEVAKAMAHIHATGNVQKDGTVTTPFVPPPVALRAPAPQREPQSHAEEAAMDAPPPFIDIPKEQRRQVDTSDLLSKIGGFAQKRALADAAARGAM